MRFTNTTLYILCYFCKEKSTSQHLNRWRNRLTLSNRQRAYWRTIPTSCGWWNVSPTCLGVLTVVASPGACAVAGEAIDAINTGAPIQTGVAHALINVFCTVLSRPAWVTLTEITWYCFLRRKKSTILQIKWTEKYKRTNPNHEKRWRRKVNI